ncbi:MAG: ribosome silencing factor [Acholeplasmataceae bacterium]|nr:ribosome silencing factor [Acholeplasmataceae bacterium]
MEKVNKIIQILQDLKVKDLVAYDFEKTSPFYDYFVIATVNERQGGAAVNHLKKALVEGEIRHVEGKGGSWVLIDMHDVIVHLFKDEDRKYYNFDQRLLGVKRIT